MLGADLDRIAQQIEKPARTVFQGTRPPRHKRALSMSDAAIRSREKKTAMRGAQRDGAGRADDATGKITIGASYDPVEGATGLPWA